ncbi:MAG: hypothetical protein WC614_11300 [bacterium]
MSNFQTTTMEKGCFVVGTETGNYQFQDYVEHTGGILKGENKLDIVKSSCLMFNANMPCTLRIRGQEVFPPEIKTELGMEMYLFYPHRKDPHVLGMFSSIDYTRVEQSKDDSFTEDAYSDLLQYLKIGFPINNGKLAFVLMYGIAFPPIFSVMFSGIISKNFSNNKINPYLRISLFEEMGFTAVATNEIERYPGGCAVCLGSEIKCTKGLDIIPELNYAYIPWYKAYRETNWMYPTFGLAARFNIQ